MTITEFLLARIEEDEAVANEANERYDADMSLWVVDDDYRHDIVGATDKRVLAECAAKRRIVTGMEALMGHEKTYLERMRHTEEQDTVYVIAASALQALASVYAEHPDYHEEWQA